MKKSPYLKENLRYILLAAAFLIFMLASLLYLSEYGHTDQYFLCGTVLEQDKDHLLVRIDPAKSHGARLPDQTVIRIELSKVSGWKDPVKTGDLVRIPCSVDGTDFFGVYDEASVEAGK